MRQADVPQCAILMIGREAVEAERVETPDYREEGRDAYRMGGDANPYSPDSRPGREWAVGWAQAHRRDLRAIDRYYKALRDEGVI
jgi:hypothetical protein